MTNTAAGSASDAAMYPLHALLWKLRHDPLVAQRFADDPGAVAAEFNLSTTQNRAIVTGDVKALYELGANPYLLYFGALETGMARDDYYAAVRGQKGHS